MRKRIGIEAFLKWAYRDELPKAQAEEGSIGPAQFGGAWGGIERYGEIGALVDFARENRWGVVPDRYARDEPHPDAVKAALAMEALDGLVVTLTDDWNPIRDLGPIGAFTADAIGEDAAELGRMAVADALADLLTRPDPQGNRRLKGGVRRLVMRFAVLNGEPGWEIEPPEVRFVCVGKGRPGWFRREIVEGSDGPYEVEVDGYNPRQRRPYPDAYQKKHLKPDPGEGIRDRGLHEVYVAALHHLHAELVDRLESYAIEFPARTARPWEDGIPPTPRILLGIAPSFFTEAA